MNKNANSVRHLQNAAIAVLTVSAVFLLVQTPLVGDLAGKTPYELAQDWLAGDTSAETSVATDLTELALPVRVAFTNEYARYGLSAITTLDADFELAGAFFSEALDSGGVYEACSGEKLLAALHASSIYLDLETPTPLNVLSKILGVADAPESSLMHVTRLLLYPAESGTTLYLQDTDQGFFFSKTSVSSTALREASLRSTATEPILLSLSPVILPTSRPTRSFSAIRRSAMRSPQAMRSPIRQRFCALPNSTPIRKAVTPILPATPSSRRSTARCAFRQTALSPIRVRTVPKPARSTMLPPLQPENLPRLKPSQAHSVWSLRCCATPSAMQSCI